MELEGQMESQQTEEGEIAFKKKTLRPCSCIKVTELAETDLELVNFLEISCNPHVL